MRKKVQKTWTLSPCVSAHFGTSPSVFVLRLSSQGAPLSLKYGPCVSNLRQHSEEGALALVLGQVGWNPTQYCELPNLSFLIYKMDSVVHLWCVWLSLR